ncbi:hypothetical protein Pmani_015322 [Petrolisthes manimaculis]|uniref:Uncharacterized protein n=1 Tax=Petrolisthes manimaculis TaxID=1843537 RepID=A0AAE1PTZ0_9EUCA|nr:hypothetical protein Pmani_015322 [Petrolisthes manimaculis]
MLFRKFCWWWLMMGMVLVDGANRSKEVQDGILCISEFMSPKNNNSLTLKVKRRSLDKMIEKHWLMANENLRGVLMVTNCLPRVPLMLLDSRFLKNRSKPKVTKSLKDHVFNRLDTDPSPPQVLDFLGG